MLTCENCADFLACAGYAGDPACDDFDGTRSPLDDPSIGDLIVTLSADKRIDDLTQVVDGLAYLVGKLERRWDKVIAAIVREANE